MKRVAIYARKSVDKGPNSVSIEMQLEDCKKKADELFPKCIITEFSDTGYSGKNTNRPDFLKMMELVDLGHFDAVIVYKLDRISRSVTDFWKIYEKLKNNNVAFVSVKDNFNTGDSFGLLIMSILATFAEMERENIATRVTDSFIATAKSDGRLLGGKAPLGFERCRNEYNHPSLRVSEKDAEIVRDLFKKYAYDLNCSINELSHYAREKYGLEKGNGSISELLSNEKYVAADDKTYKYWKGLGCEILKEKEYWIGTNACYALFTKTHHKDGRVTINDPKDWKVTIGNWKPIVDTDIWLIVQKRKKENKDSERNTRMVDKMKWKELTGLVHCPECGSSVKIVGGEGSAYRNISCTRKYQGPGKNTCTYRFTKLKPETVWENVAIKIQKYLDNEDLRSESTKDVLDRSYKKQIKYLEKQADNLAEAIAKNSSPALLRQLDEVQRKIEEQNLAMVNNMNSEEDLIAARITNFTRGKKIDYRSLSVEEKKSLLGILISKIYLHRDGTVVFEWRGVIKDPEDAIALTEAEGAKKRAEKEELIAKAKELGLEIVDNTEKTEDGLVIPDDYDKYGITLDDEEDQAQ